MSCMTKAKAGKAICNKCKEPAKLFYKKWWCGVASDVGIYNLKGVCLNESKKN